MGNVLSKLGAASRAGAVATALRGDLLNSADPRVGPGAAGRERWAQGALRYFGAFLLVALVLVAGFATAATVVGTINVNDLRLGATASPRATDFATPRATTPPAAPLSSIGPGPVAPQVQNPSAAPPPASPAAPIPTIVPSVATASLPPAATLAPAPSSVSPVPLPTIVPPLPTPSLLP